MALSRLTINEFSTILKLIGPHQISPAEEASSTIRLSLGDLPFFNPESVTSAPDPVKAVPFSSASACSYKTETEPFRMIGFV
jgi:hypothetical protein